MWNDIFALTIATIALFFSLYAFTIARRSKRAKLINAIYYHLKETQKWLGSPEREEENKETKSKISKEDGFMPFFTRSSADDLSYDHIMEAMEWMSSEENGDTKSEEELLSKYFHRHADLCAHIESFTKEQFMDLETSRKLKLWEGYENAQEATCQYVSQLLPILEKKKAEITN